MKQEKEKWLKDLRGSMEDYSITPKADGWDRLEKKLQPIPVVPRRSYYMYSAAAAVALLLIVSSTAIYLLGDRTAEYAQTAQIPSIIEKANKTMPSSAIPNCLNTILPHKTVNQLAIKEAKHRSGLPTDNSDMLDNSIESAETTVATTINTKSKISKEALDETNQITNKEEVNQAKEVQETLRPIRKKMENVVELEELPRKKGARNWSIGLTAGNSSGFSSIEGNAKSFSHGRLAYTSPLLTTEELTRLQSAPQVKLNHKLPITFGASVRKQISDHIAIQSGLTYTRLESELLNRNNDYATYNQTLHYIGIPVKMDYLLYNNRFVTLYLSAGGAVEKCVSGESKTVEHIEGNETNETTNSIKVNPLQWSVGSALGIQFNLNKQLGIFAEPGATYFFKDGSDVQTIRKETPFNFNLQLGLRISY